MQLKSWNVLCKRLRAANNVFTHNINEQCNQMHSIIFVVDAITEVSSCSIGIGCIFTSFGRQNIYNNQATTTQLSISIDNSNTAKKITNKFLQRQ